MELGIIILFAGLLVIMLVSIITRNSSGKSRRTYNIPSKSSKRIRTVGPCAVAVGVYKEHKDRKSLEKMRDN
jgi:hypothetical protein